MTPAEFHEQNRIRAEDWPGSLLAGSTHDTKRSEDVRARMNVLSEIPEEWARAVKRWRLISADKKKLVLGAPAPDNNDEYHLYQILVGAWPMDGGGPDETFRERISAYMAKATKEAKLHTSWTEPDTGYDAAMQGFVEDILLDDNVFLKDFAGFQARVAYYGRLNSMAQTLLKLTSPGVPGLYQGSELWDLHLVDADNRRPVDYASRRSLLAELRRQLEHGAANLDGLVDSLLDSSGDGQVKLYLIHRVLGYRRDRRDVFQCGSYLPLQVTGEKREHVCAFARKVGDEEVVVVAPRLLVKLTGGIERPPLGRDIGRIQVWSSIIRPSTSTFSPGPLSSLSGVRASTAFRWLRFSHTFQLLCSMADNAIQVRYHAHDQDRASGYC